MVGPVRDKHAVAGLCQIFGTNSTTAARSNDDDICLNHLLIFSQWYLQEAVIEPFPGLPMDGRSWETKHRIDGAALLDPRGYGDSSQGFDQLT